MRPTQIVSRRRLRQSAGVMALLLNSLLLAIAGPTLAETAESEDQVTAGVTVPVIEAKLQEVEANQELDAQHRELLVELYRKSISNLESHEANLAATEKFHRSIETAPLESQRLEQELAEFEGRAYDPRPHFAEAATTATIAQALLKERANLSAVEADYNRLKLKLENQQDRLNLARKELTLANTKQSEQAGESAPKDAQDEPAEVAKAREWYRSTSLRELGSQIKKLDQELLSYGPRMELLKLQLARRELTRQHLETRVAAIEAILGEHRKAEASQALRVAQAAQVAAEGKHPLLVEVAQGNAAIGEQLLTMTREMEGISRLASAAEQQAKSLEAEYRSVRQKLEVAGMNRALGKILQDQRAALPDARKLETEINKREKLIADIALQQLVFDENLKGLADLDAAVERRLSGLGGKDDATVFDREKIAADLRAMLTQRQSLYKKTLSVSAAYLQGLSDLEYAQRKLLDNVQRYDAFLGERLLWVRSVPGSGIETLLSFSSESRYYLTPAPWLEVGEQLVKFDVYWFVLLAGTLLAALLVRKKPDLRARLEATNKHIGNPASDRFRYSLQALLLTLLLSAAGTIMFTSLGIKQQFSAQGSPLSHALAQGCFWLAQSWFFIYTCRQICRPNGLARHHFGWHEQVLLPLRKEFTFLLNTFLPVSFVTVTLAGLDASGMEWGIVRLALIITMLLFALFFVRVFRANGGVMRALKAIDPDMWLVRWRNAWLLLAVVIPLTLTGFAASGYVYTAATLMGSFIGSFWVAIIAVVIHELGMRWLRKTSVQLNYQALQEERKKQIQQMYESREAGQAMADIAQEDGIDLLRLGQVSMKLVNIMTGLLAVLGLSMVWSDVIPALAYLDNMELWHYSGSDGGETVIKAVSLGDLGIALLLIALVVFIYRNLPSLLELLFLQVSAMTASDRYTVITLTRYTILIVGVLLIAGILGLSWSQFQWMAAALGVGIGFGLQEIVANFISGLIILFERPIRVGDRVTVGDVDGMVTRIRMRATTILTWDRQELLVPNKEFITGRLLNWSLSDQVSRLVISVGVAYGSDVARAMSLMAQAAEQHDKVMTDPAPFVSFEGFGDNTLNLKLRCYLDDMSVRLSTTTALHEAINTAFNEAGIVIAFPQRDIHFDPDHVMNVRLRTDQAGPSHPEPL